MSFLKKYKTQFDDAKKKYLPDESKKEQEHAPQYGDPSQPPTATPAVPPNWTATWDPTQSHWTYHNATTGQTQTTHPDPVNYGGQTMPPGGPVLDKDGKPKKDKNGLLIGAAGGLAGGMLGKWAMKKAVTGMAVMVMVATEDTAVTAVTKRVTKKASKKMVVEVRNDLP
ncbi:MAG: hypothetical protein Q9178_005724 [Gyalolechia marmorata]